MLQSEERTRWATILASCFIGIALLMQVPQFLHVMQPEWKGVLVHLNSDEYHYLPRVMEALSGRPEQAAEGIVGDEHVAPLQGAMLESLSGMLFGWTGFRAATVLQIMDSVVPPILFLVLWWFFTLSGFSRKEALAGSLIFVVLEFYNLGRPIHQRMSFLLVLLAMCTTITALHRTWYMGLVAGWLMGLLVGVYFWSWTYVWAWWGILLLWEVAEWLYLEKHESKFAQVKATVVRSILKGMRHFLPQRKQKEVPYQHRFFSWQWLLIFGVFGALIAIPFVLQIIGVSTHPFFEVAQLRNQIHHSFAPESWIRSGLFFGMVLGIAVALWQGYHLVRPYKYTVVAVVASFVVLNQQMIHGTVLQFSSHYLFPLVFGGVACLLLSFAISSRWMILSGACAAVFLAGIAYDGRYVFRQFEVRAEDFAEQHFATLLPVLDVLPRTRILSDQDTSLFVAGHTKHDVVYSPYLVHTLLSDEELLQRYCLTRLPILPDNRNYKQDLKNPLLLPQMHSDAAYLDFAASELLRVCSEIDVEPEVAIRNFGVHYILWDELRQPEWNINSMNISLQEVKRGAGWSLWEVL